MALLRFDEMDDMYGRIDRMMNSMMNNMFNSDPFGFNAMNPFNRFNALLPSHQSLSYGHNLYDMNPMNMMNGMSAMNGMNGMNGESYYCSSSVMSMSTDATGRPQIYEASSSTRAAPGGVRETRKTVRDSVSGLQSMSIGHHIRDRGHVMERSRNHYTGDEEQNEEYINLEETEAPQFNEEWQTRMSSAYRGHPSSHLAIGHRPHGHRSAPQQLALPSSQSSNVSQNMQKNKMSQKKQKDKKNKKPYKKA